MPKTFTTRRDLAAFLAERLDLDPAAVAEAISDHGDLFGNYGRIPAAELATLSAAVWTDITRTAYPYADQDAAAIAEESE
jgi:hypothetical protein